MTPETNVDLRRQKPSVVFDTESVALLGKFGDQITAYRAKKKWGEILHNHFLLEVERDYEIAVTSSHDTGLYVLGCTFTSACGRYSFWRLINHQAPDAEQKICQASNTKSIQQGSTLSSSTDVLNAVAARAMPWLMTGLAPKPQSAKRERRGTLSDVLSKIFGRV